MPDSGAFPLAAATDLVRALMGIARTQSRWLGDVGRVCDGDPAWLEALRRWEEHLSLLKLQIHRAEARLLHYLRVPEDRRPWRELPGPPLDRHATYRSWQLRLVAWTHRLHLDTRYRRLIDIRDLDADATTGDVVTDLSALCEISTTTGVALERCSDLRIDQGLEVLAYYHVLSPWRQQGMTALLDVLRWLSVVLAEESEL